MARNKSNQTSQKQNARGRDVTYADVRYSEADMNAFSNWLLENDLTMEDAIETLTADSYRVTNKFDYNNNCHSVTITQQEETKHKNSGIILIVRASTASKACILAAWTVFEMYHNEPLPVDRGNDEVWF